MSESDKPREAALDVTKDDDIHNNPGKDVMGTAPKEFVINGYSIIIDQCMLPIISQFQWYVLKGRNTHYVYTNIKIGNKNHALSMHRLLTGIRKAMVDHKNRNGLDNRMSNLRYCTAKENSRNRVRENKLGYRGVYKPAKTNTFAFQIRAGGKHKSGYGFKTPEDAARAYDEASKELHGEFGIRNFKD